MESIYVYISFIIFTFDSTLLKTYIEVARNIRTHSSNVFQPLIYVGMILQHSYITVLSCTVSHEEQVNAESGEYCGCVRLIVLCCDSYWLISMIIADALCQKTDFVFPYFYLHLLRQQKISMWLTFGNNYVMYYTWESKIIMYMNFLYTHPNKIFVPGKMDIDFYDDIVIHKKHQVLSTRLILFVHNEKLCSC